MLESVDLINYLFFFLNTNTLIHTQHTHNTKSDLSLSFHFLSLPSLHQHHHHCHPPLVGHRTAGDQSRHQRPYQTTNAALFLHVSGEPVAVSLTAAAFLFLFPFTLFSVTPHRILSLAGKVPATTLPILFPLKLVQSHQKNMDRSAQPLVFAVDFFIFGVTSAKTVEAALLVPFLWSLLSIRWLL